MTTARFVLDHATKRPRLKTLAERPELMETNESKLQRVSAVDHSTAHRAVHNEANSPCVGACRNLSVLVAHRASRRCELYRVFHVVAVSGAGSVGRVHGAPESGVDGPELQAKYFFLK